MYPVDVLADIYLLHIFTYLKTVFISCKMIWTLEAFIQIGPIIFHKKFLTMHVTVNFLEETKYSTSIQGFFKCVFGAEFRPHSQCKNNQYFLKIWLKIPKLKFLSESEPSSANTCSRLVSLCKPSYPQIMKVIPKLSITSNSSILYFLYGARSYAEEFNHLKLQLCRTGNSQFH